MRKINRVYQEQLEHRRTRHFNEISARLTGEKKNSSESKDHHVWYKGRKIKKNDRMIVLDNTFIDWLGEDVTVEVDKSRLLVTGRENHWSGLDIPYVRMNMRGGHRYRVSVLFSPYKPVDDRETTIDFLVLAIFCGKSFDTNNQWYQKENRFAQRLSEENLAEGEWEEVSVELDFSNMDRLPGFMRIQTLQNDKIEDSSFYLDWIKVIDIDTGETVYYNDFDAGWYEAAEDIPADEENPQKSKKWKRVPNA